MTESVGTPNGLGWLFAETKTEPPFLTQTTFLDGFQSRVLY